jgi:hypothetical protein
MDLASASAIVVGALAAFWLSFISLRLRLLILSFGGALEAP